MMSIYKVTKQFGGGREQPCHQFKTLPEAQKHAADSVENNVAMKIKAVFRIYEFDDLIETVDTDSYVPPTSSVNISNDSSQGGKQSGATFKPTPFEMSPRPKGTAPKWIIDSDEETKKDK
tara:strand:- start:145 stop:504 length:360 start_codon:yes stop_codon:yes gene_type:complete